MVQLITRARVGTRRSTGCAVLMASIFVLHFLPPVARGQVVEDEAAPGEVSAGLPHGPLAHLGRPLGAIASTTWSAAFTPSGSDAVVYSGTVYGDEVILGGEFHRLGRYLANGVVGYDGTRTYGFGTGLHGRVAALVVWRNQLIAGGQKQKKAVNEFFVRMGNCRARVVRDDVFARCA